MNEQDKDFASIMNNYHTSLKGLPYVSPELRDKVYQGILESSRYPVNNPFLDFASMNPALIKRLLEEADKGISKYFDKDLYDRDRFWDGEERTWERQRITKIAQAVFSRFDSMVADLILDNYITRSHVKNVLIKIISSCTGTLDSGRLIAILNDDSLHNAHGSAITLIKMYPDQKGLDTLIDYANKRLVAFPRRENKQYPDHLLNQAIVTIGQISNELGHPEGYEDLLGMIIKNPALGKAMRKAALDAISLGSFTNLIEEVRAVYSAEETAESGMSLWFGPPKPLTAKAMAVLLAFEDRSTLYDLYVQIRDMDPEKYNYEVIYETLSWSIHERQPVLTLIESISEFYRDDPSEHKSRAIWEFASRTVQWGFGKFVSHLHTKVKLIGYALLILSYQPEYKEKAKNDLSINISFDIALEKAEPLISEFITKLLEEMDYDEETLSEDLARDLTKSAEATAEFIISKMKESNLL